MTSLFRRASAALGLLAILAAALFGAAIVTPAASMGATTTPHLILTLKDGDVDIQLMPDLAPKHVARIIELTQKGAYDGVVFHRVLDGFMAQTGDVKYGKTDGPDYNLQMAGGGGSDLPDVPAEFSSTHFGPGVVGAARTDDPNSFNSQFFIMFADNSGLDGQYTVFGKVVSGMDLVNKITRRDPQFDLNVVPDKIISAKIVDK